MNDESYLRDKEKYKILVEDREDRNEMFSILGCMSGTYRQMITEKFPHFGKREYIEAWLTEDEILMLKLRVPFKFEFYRMGL